MLEIRKHYVLDENQQPIAVQISLSDFEQIEALLKQLGEIEEAETAEPQGKGYPPNFFEETFGSLKDDPLPLEHHDAFEGQKSLL